MVDEQLENPDNWNFERAERRSGIKRARAVVSVAFSRDDFERVADAAEGAGMKVSEFIRNATLETVERRNLPDPVFSLVVGPTFKQLYLRGPSPSTYSFWGGQLVHEDEAAAVVSGWYS